MNFQIVRAQERDPTYSIDLFDSCAPSAGTRAEYYAIVQRRFLTLVRLRVTIFRSISTIYSVGWVEGDDLSPDTQHLLGRLG
jgi:hypothetical protein